MIHTILLIEDQGSQRAIYNFDLLKSGYNTLIAATGEKGIALAAEHKPDLIVSDLLLPGIDGYETLRRLKANDTTKNIPVILISCLSQKENIMKGFEAGASAYIPKPFKFEQLRDEITKLIGKT